MKVSIVTPSFNSARFIRQTIESVLAQEGDFDIEYILQDGGSTDDTVQIWEELKSANTNPHITMRAFSEKDAGMYDALNKGFARATGDIFAYLNSDDMYLPGALAAVATAFANPGVEWVKGTNIVIDEDGAVIRRNRPLSYKRAWIRRGIYGRYAPFIEQETVFWRRALWEKAGPFDASLRYAGDYKLWINFAAHAELVSIATAVSAFRRHGEQLSAGVGYRQEQARVLPPGGTVLEWLIKLFYWLKNRLGV
ncbi:MAG: glycosyltransferase [Patescibacteria group bacterium]|nr:glycosyltransferase [Patescibacteria group bacterium]